MICDSTEQIDIRKLRRLMTTVPDVFEFEGERIVTTWTKMHFGGARQWFLCPSCDRRCAIIYRVGNGPLWQCRVCGNGKYRSDSMSPHGRRLRQAIKLRNRLGQDSGGILRTFPKRPKRIHKKTYTEFMAKAIKLERQILKTAVDRLPPSIREKLKSKQNS